MPPNLPKHSQPQQNAASLKQELQSPRKLAFIAVLLSFVGLIFGVPQHSLLPSPDQPNTVIVDKVNLVSQEFINTISRQLLEENRMQMIIYIDAQPPGNDLATWTIQAASAWQIGAEKKDTGLILFIFRDAQIARVEVGYGLEGALPDAKVHQILETTIFPSFSKAEYEQGLENFINALGDQLEDSARQRLRAKSSWVGSWLETLDAGLERAPRMLKTTYQTFLAGDIAVRCVLLIFVGVASWVIFTDVVIGLYTFSCIALLLRNGRAGTVRFEQNQGRSENTQLLLIGQIVLGIIAFSLFFMLLMLVFSAADGMLFKKGHFGGAGAYIYWQGA